MNGLERLLVLVSQTLNLHQATRIARDDEFRLRLKGAGAFDFAHRGRDGGKLRRERPAETAARFRRAHFDQFQTLHLREQFAGRALVVQLAQTVAAIVERDLDRKSTRLNSSHSQQSRMPSSA